MRFVAVVLVYILGFNLVNADACAQEQELNELSLEEISRRLENPLSDLWSLTFQENLYLNTGELIDDTELSNVLFFQPFLVGDAHSHQALFGPISGDFVFIWRNLKYHLTFSNTVARFIIPLFDSA